MKKFRIQNTRFIYLTILICACLFGCKKNTSHKLEKDLALKIAEYIIKNDSLKTNHYSREMILHIASERLNKNHYKTYVSLNSLIPTFDNFKTEKLEIKDFKTIVYYYSTKDKFNLAETFFVPDSKSWEFLSKTYNDEIYLNKVEYIYTKKKAVSKEINNLDF